MCKFHYANTTAEAAANVAPRVTHVINHFENLPEPSGVIYRCLIDVTEEKQESLGWRDVEFVRHLKEYFTGRNMSRALQI